MNNIESFRRPQRKGKNDIRERIQDVDKLMGNEYISAELDSREDLYENKQETFLELFDSYDLGEEEAKHNFDSITANFGEKEFVDLALYLLEGDYSFNLNQFFEKKYQFIILDKLLNQRKFDAIIHNVSYFSEVDQTDLANKLIDAGEGRSVAENLEKFEGLDYVEVANKLIETGAGRYVAANLEKFEGLNVEIANRLIDAGAEWHVAENLKKFEGLNAEIANKLIDAGRGGNVVYNLEKFEGLNAEIANRLIDAGEGRYIANNLEKFEGLNAEIGNWFIEAGTGWSVAENLGKFEGLDHVEVANKLIEAGEGWRVAANLEKFEGLDHVEVANKLIETEAGRYVAANLEKFEGLDHVEVANKLIEAGKGGSVAENLEKFEGLDHVEVANKLIEAGVGGSVAANLEKFGEYLKDLISQVGEEYFRAYEDELKKILYKNERILLTESDIEYLEKRDLIVLNFFEVQQLKKKKPLEEWSLKTNEAAQEIFEIIKENGEDWQDAEIVSRFERGAEIFGYKRMFEFVGDDRHDALYGFEHIIRLYEISQLKPRVFYANILQQVSMDSGAYGDNNDTSYQKLNEIAQGFPDIQKTIQEARRYQDIPQLGKLLKELNSVKDVFQSWKMLIQFKEISLLLERKEILEGLQKESDEKLREYTTTLLFHPSVSNTSAIKSFWKDPYQFLDMSSSHTSHEVHNAKKPTNYLDIPNLDLHAEELRDALVHGDMDRLQVWHPMETLYEIADDPKAFEAYQAFLNKPFTEMLQASLGPGAKVKNKMKLFGNIRSILEKYFSFDTEGRKKVTEIIQGIVRRGELPEQEIPPEIDASIRKEIYFGRFGYAKRIRISTYKVKINRKSDPDGVVAGSDTQSCMPFGDGKNTIYTYNPICSLFTIQREMGDGTYRTLAQSVLTKDMNVQVPISQILGSEGKSLSEVMSQDILHKEDSIIACDSVEVANNYRTEEYSRIITDIYRDFLADYVERFGEEQGLSSEKAVVGNYSEKLKKDGNEPNTYLPKSPVAYSDKYIRDVGILRLEKRDQPFFLSKETEVLEIDQREVVSLLNPRLAYLTFEDSLETGFIEGKAYTGTNLKVGVSEMENSLIAKDINNETKGRPNMSLKYVSEEGNMEGYLVAYEGVYGHNPTQYEQVEGETCLYVMDLAKMPGSQKGIGVAMIDEFIRLYQENYVKKDRLVPIRAEAREVSSYKLVQRRLDKWGRIAGIRFVLEEEGTTIEGNDIMHNIIIRPVRK